MRVHLGPVSSSSVRMWVAYARTVLAQALSQADAPPIGDEVVRNFEWYLDAWDDAAARQDEVVWVGEIAAEQLEFLAHAFYRLTAVLAEEADQRGYPISPPEGEEFYQALVRAIIEALEHEDDARAAFSEQLRADWPGYKEA